MTRSLRFFAVLFVGLAVLTWASWLLVNRTTTAWFAKDLGLRALLAIKSVRSDLLERSGGDPVRMAELLTDVAQDERILAAGVCSDDGSILAHTAEFPLELPCTELAVELSSTAPGALWTRVEPLYGGNVHVAALPIDDQDRSQGFVVLVQDLSFVQRREATTRKFLFVAFGFLALAASGMTLIARYMSWRTWSDELLRFLRGGGARKEFQPILRDVRELVDRIVTEEEGGTWTPERLKLTLDRFLHGERVVCLSNREPYVHQHAEDGRIEELHPASGLVTAVEPVMRACSGTWIAHGSGSADRDTADSSGRLRVPPGEGSYWLRRVWLSEEEERGYYYGFANEGIWPLCHIAHARPIFRSSDWQHYRAVNRRFADAVCEEVDGDDPIVLVQDYHFALCPRMIRERLPRATVLMFWHIPWPNSEHFGICPWREELMDGMLGASILGFHTQFHCNNFLDSADRFLEARIDRAENTVAQRGRRTLVRPYPISLEWPVRWTEAADGGRDARAKVFEELGLQSDALLAVGVDRLDYTKGIEERFLAVERLLETQPELRGRLTFVQLAAPSRVLIPRYQSLNEAIEAVVERINARFGRGAWRPIVLLRTHHEPPVVFRFYRAADVCYVSSLHDGMNLVAKEFVAARSDEQGVLVLSQFTGAARELTEALIVNPYDVEEAASALSAALSMTAEEQRERMRAMRAYLAEFNVYRWAGRMLVDAARLRRSERVSGRLSTRATRRIFAAG